MSTCPICKRASCNEPDKCAELIAFIDLPADDQFAIGRSLRQQYSKGPVAELPRCRTCGQVRVLSPCRDCGGTGP